jgi:F-type H+-transporting ATPase subunit b
MIFNVWTFLFQVVNFLVLVAILRWLLYRPLREAIDRRGAANARAQADADAARRDAEGLRATLDQQLADLEHRRERVIREARDRAETERQATMADAEAAIRRRREEVEEQIARERDEVMRQLRSELVHSAVDMAQRLLREASDATLQRQLAIRLIEELESIPDDERRRLRDEWDDGETAVIETAGELIGDALRDLGGAVESLAGRRLDVSIRHRPDLLGGLRLRIGGHVWDASLAGPLEDLASSAKAGAAAEGSTS